MLIIGILVHMLPLESSFGLVKGAWAAAHCYYTEAQVVFYFTWDGVVSALPELGLGEWKWNSVGCLRVIPTVLTQPLLPSSHYSFHQYELEKRQKAPLHFVPCLCAHRSCTHGLHNTPWEGSLTLSILMQPYLNDVISYLVHCVWGHHLGQILVFFCSINVHTKLYGK